MSVSAIDPQAWTALSACRDADPDELFVTGAAQNRAKAVCMGCPVLDDCLGFAIETNQPDGIWGGYTSKERTKIRRQWLEDVRRAS